MDELEYEIECAVSRKIDRIDARFMRGEYTQKQYDNEIIAVRNWAENQYRLAEIYTRAAKRA